MHFLKYENELLSPPILLYSFTQHIIIEGILCESLLVGHLFTKN